MKQCVKCEIFKPYAQFRIYNNGSFSETCKCCYNELDKIRKNTNRQKILETMITTCEMCEANKPLKDFAKLKKYYKRKICLTCYPTFLNAQKIETHSNINYRIKKSIAARLRSVLTKKTTTMNYIGCNIQYLREWFEYNFTEEMNWDNYGLHWSIDHVIPVCNFDLTNENEKLKCWNWSNMVPVSVKFNSAKKTIVLEQVEKVVSKLEKFKEEGSTTKWFSGEFTLNKQYAMDKMNCDININSS